MKKYDITFETKPPINKTEEDIKITKDKAYDILIRELILKKTTKEN
ncbi:hypothetical protein [Schinkia azotoformans]|nr:hypothetical protein [Schinkia azotoformans]MEC1780094.1 hypothetical protein [Schinkia azotoformans]MED4330827.1 hypothetical protein [Schinkia azotoformans]